MNFSQIVFCMNVMCECALVKKKLNKIKQTRGPWATSFTRETASINKHIFAKL